MVHLASEEKNTLSTEVQMVVTVEKVDQVLMETLEETQVGQDQILYQVVAQKIMVQVQHQAEQEFHIMNQA